MKKSRIVIIAASVVTAVFFLLAPVNIYQVVAEWLYAWRSGRRSK